MVCLMCDKGNFEIYTSINREPVEVNEGRHAKGLPRGFGEFMLFDIFWIPPRLNFPINDIILANS